MGEQDKKSVYQVIREELNLSREKASELLDSISPTRLERIESGKFTAYPEEVVVMADKYQAPNLRNYYCTNECAIGRQYMPEIKMKDLTQIVLEMLVSLNSMEKRQERLIESRLTGKSKVMNWRILYEYRMILRRFQSPSKHYSIGRSKDLLLERSI